MSQREISLVVGTAGHIDHGKTQLVKAMTGVDCDRLNEEKKRGITIELGFAPLILPSERVISLIDVPGHDRFIRQMVSGASGVDAVLFVEDGKIAGYGELWKTDIPKDCEIFDARGKYTAPASVSGRRW